MSLTQPAENQTQPAPLPQRTSAGGIKETIESILVAFILAFVFRAFVVEAFVIPTGSMAPTLLGAHTRFHCPDCGYDFDVNYQPPVNRNDPESDDPPIPATAGKMTNAIYCPNCGFPMPNDQTDNPPVFFGDRILVLKYLYMLAEPQRWDVVVFKAPIAMTTNYIKRLIGKPGESVMVLDGDVYIRPPGGKDFTVQPKPKPAQDALWRLVYDNDFHPVGKLDRDSVHQWTQPWTPVAGTGWQTQTAADHGRTFLFDGQSSSSATLRYNPVANPTAQSISDYMVYDQQADAHYIPIRPTESRFPGTPTDSSYNGEIPVSDLDVRATYQRTSGTGPFEMRLTKRGHTFIAQVNTDQALLLQEFNGKRSQIGAGISVNPSHPLRIELSNADYQVTLRINGEIVAQSTPADFAPDINALIQEFNDHRTPPPGNAEISAAGQQCQISHLSLWRDDYYYNDRAGVTWATPTHPQVLGPDEYFVMGDNSILSYDARCWTTGVHLPAEKLDVDPGRVPARFLLGKAFYVYWPAGYVATPMLPAFVPNFGAMRFIH